jgi:XTP/dITP diphosphohydrolase
MSWTGRIVVVVVSARTAPGLLSWPAWEALRAAGRVFAADPDPAWLQALDEAGVAVEDLIDVPVAERAGRLLESAAGTGDEAPRQVVWFGSPDGDPGLTEALAEHLARRAVAGEPPEVELLVGSHDLPGARLLDLVAVMDRLRSPGGCPWDAEQTHTTLVPYLLEETHEVIEAIEAPGGLDRDHLAEELGDLLLQVVFHARIAEEHSEAPFDVDAVAAGIVAKLVRRHPHVFADVEVDGAEQVAANWEQIKAVEKRREHPFEGIPATLPSLARAQKMLDRRGGAVPEVGDPIARALLDVVRTARGSGRDAESALRSALGRLGESHAEPHPQPHPDQ